MMNRMVFPFGQAMLLISAVGFQALAQPVVISVSPNQNEFNVPIDSGIAPTFSQNMEAGTSQTFPVYGYMTGKLPGTYSGNGTSTLAFAPDSPFFPGEKIDVSLTTGLKQIGIGQPFLDQPVVWNFLTKPRPSAGTFATSQDVSSDMHISDAVVVGDVDGDGDLDLVVGDYNKIRLYLNNGSSNRWQGVSSIELPGEDHRPHVLALGDVDGDGDLDLVEGNIQQPNFVFLNNGTLNPWDGVTPKQLPGGSLHTESVLLGDVDGDGDLDLIVGNINDPNFLCLNNGTADPWMGATATVISASENLTEHLALGDVDNDGDLDLVEGNGNGGSYPNFLYLNNGTSNPWDGVVHGKITDDEYDTRHIELGDVDGDGDLDLVTLNYVQPNRLYLNNGTNAPWAGVAGIDISSDVAQVHGGAIGDVDGDSDLDLLVATGLTEKQKNRLYLNNGTANPWSGVAGTDITNDTFATRTMALGDIDGDGDLDLVTAEANAADGIPEYINHYYINSGFNGGFNGGLSAVDNWEHYR